MSHRAWMADAERLMNLMERFDYKSEQYNVCRKVLLSHLAKKPKHDEEATAWTMTGPAPFEFEDDFAPPPVVELDFYLPSEPEPEPVTSTAIAAEISDTAAATPATEIATAMAAESVPPAKAKKRRAATKKSTASAEKKPKKAPTDKPKRVRKKATSTKVEPGENPPA